MTTFFQSLSSAQTALQRATLIIDDTRPTFPVGFVGSLGYELKTATLPHLVPEQNINGESDAEFAFAAIVLSYEHATSHWTVSGLVRTEGTGTIAVEAEWSCRFGVAEAEWTAHLATLTNYFATAATSSLNSSSCTKRLLSTDLLVPDIPEPLYKIAIEQARRSISAGDAYELCITTQFRTILPTSTADDPYTLYRFLRQSNPAPYSAYFHLPQSRLALLSSSPERFMHITKHGEVEMKPIKGTVRRTPHDPVEDERRRRALQADDKERAENLMIVDLCRNDLLGCCSVESVTVPRLMIVESYETVHQ